MIVEIDKKSGFCFGVVYAIQKAEEELEKHGKLYCLGDIVHNNVEVERLSGRGLITIDHEQFRNLRDCMVLIRAHGEPPETYKIALENNIELIDASCPVVLKLQNRIKNGFDLISKQKGQIVIYGKEGHAEVNGLVGQTKYSAIVIGSVEDLDKLDYTKPINLFSQTTQSKEGFRIISEEIKRRLEEANGKDNYTFYSNDTICRQVSHREPDLIEFSKHHDVIIFVSGKKSSNGKILYTVCKSVNEKTYFVSEPKDIEKSWFEGVNSVGVCGATSTPRWLMEKISEKIQSF